MITSLVVAMSKNHVIGVDNHLPWHLPADLKHFKTVTLGKPIVMGRKTYESIGKPLPGRENVILTRNSDFDVPGCWVTGDIEAVFQKYRDTPEIMIIGGAQIFEHCLPLADRMYLTYVDLEIKGDALFPFFDAAEWKEIERIEYPADDNNKYACTFCTLVRIKGKE